MLSSPRRQEEEDGGADVLEALQVGDVVGAGGAVHQDVLVLVADLQLRVDSRASNEDSRRFYGEGPCRGGSHRFLKLPVCYDL